MGDLVVQFGPGSLQKSWELGPRSPRPAGKDVWAIRSLPILSVQYRNGTSCITCLSEESPATQSRALAKLLRQGPFTSCVKAEAPIFLCARLLGDRRPERRGRWGWWVEWGGRGGVSSS